LTVTVAIVGRPNVGKSTLFNRLVGRRIALVDDTPGVTRDRREAEGRIGDLRFKVLDTAGYEDKTDGSLEDRMRQQTEIAIRDADVILFMIDAKAGVTPLDERFAQVLRRAGKDVHLIGNKAEGRAAEPGLLEAYNLGFGEPVALSAEHGQGLADLHAIVSKAVDAAAEKAQAEAPTLDVMPEVDVDLPEDDGSTEDGPVKRWDPKRHLNVAIIGRPNAGKSTLINRMVGEERLLTGPEAGITRDSILVPWEYEGRTINLVDTAGMRRKARIEQKLEKAGGQRFPALDPVCRSRRAAARCADPVRKAGPDARRPGGARGPRDGHRRQQVGHHRGQERQARRIARAVRALPAAAQGHPAGHHLGPAGPQYRQADAGDLRHRAQVEQPRLDGAAQPLAQRHDREPSAPGRVGTPPETALHDAGQDPAAELHPLRLAVPKSPRAQGQSTYQRYLVNGLRDLRACAN
jgi:small GTP-binding protein